MVTASDDNTARVWEADTGKPVGVPLQHQGAVNSAAFSPDGRRVVTASWDKTARVWDADTGKPVGAPLQHQGSCRFRRVQPGRPPRGDRFCDNTARVWEADTGKPVGAPLQHQRTVNSAAFSPDGRRVVTASWTIRRGCGRPTPASRWARPCNKGTVNSAAFSPDGRRVVTASSDHTARVWEADTGKPVGAPLQHQELSIPPRSVPTAGAW